MNEIAYIIPVRLHFNKDWLGKMIYGSQSELRSTYMHCKDDRERWGNWSVSDNSAHKDGRWILTKTTIDNTIVTVSRDYAGHNN